MLRHPKAQRSLALVPSSMLQHLLCMARTPVTSKVLTSCCKDTSLRVAVLQPSLTIKLCAHISIPGERAIQEAVEQQLQPPRHHQAHLQQ